MEKYDNSHHFICCDYNRQYYGASFVSLRSLNYFVSRRVGGTTRDDVTDSERCREPRVLRCSRCGVERWSEAMMMMMMTEESVTGDIGQCSDWTHWRRSRVISHVRLI
ncbi:hypothetical protein IRJ41_003286 [Triplophysa rosa]|uniref:Uncharacterized protein n=1 Tax=Triplophysa rosa TaxID=992332 RepID=A0A9W7WEZ7_TRIRA|nr:hypothetical protein IRJ41_003286 [Triplophysa rosa]